MPDRTVAISDRGSGPTDGPPSDLARGWYRGCEVAGLWGLAVAHPVRGLLCGDPGVFGGRNGRQGASHRVAGEAYRIEIEGLKEG